MAKLMVHRNILEGLPQAAEQGAETHLGDDRGVPEGPARSVESGCTRWPREWLDPKVRAERCCRAASGRSSSRRSKGDTYLLVHIDAHDKAYEWARNKRFEVHEMTGVVPGLRCPGGPGGGRGAAATGRGQAGGYPLGKLSDEELFTAGVPKPLVAAVRSIHSDAALTALSDYLPPDCRDVLFGIAAGHDVGAGTGGDAGRARPRPQRQPRPAPATSPRWRSRPTSI